ncbi:S-formylglutathione hydrolase [Plesiomonas shigelloides]|uniref:S-formylglutathione hydrolase n=1 Tax=Plesiomonas shigelloides TaxID=703 RepID=UPI00126240C8|nr:S-formylglutathione hydrolase [Plesiomonas shigelloides]KAB7695401.1 S-formylglutathione hydrolase [Plesiomonas shigelloides]
MKLVESHACFGGLQNVYRHYSNTLKCEMNVGIYFPRQSKTEKLPVLYWLSGLTCSEQNFITKSGFQRYADLHNIIVVCPDTSPRGDSVPDIDRYDLGQGAGFYLNAIKSPWHENYRMYDYILDELPSLIIEHTPAIELKSICGHSMGGHGALILAIRNPEEFASVSALSPIVSPSQVEWGINAFSTYLGDNKISWKEYDATDLILQGNYFPEIFIDQGLSDQFYADQLRTKEFGKACNEMNISNIIRYHDGYDHSYYFISSFIAEHIAYHANKLHALRSI